MDKPMQHCLEVRCIIIIENYKLFINYIIIDYCRPPCNSNATLDDFRVNITRILKSLSDVSSKNLEQIRAGIRAKMQ